MAISGLEHYGRRNVAPKSPKMAQGGFLRFAPIGGCDPRILPAKQVEIKARNGKKVRGVIGASPPHIQTPEEQKQALKVEDLFVDIGVRLKEEVLERGIDVGSPGTLDYPFQLMEQKRIMAKGPGRPGRMRHSDTMSGILLGKAAGFHVGRQLFRF